MPQAVRSAHHGAGKATARLAGPDTSEACRARRPPRGGEPDRYDVIARFFHWIFAAGILYASIAGYTLTRLPAGPGREWLSQLNMSITTVLIALFPLRMAWIFVRAEPRALPGIPAAQRVAARLVHALLYLTIFAALASGFLMVPNGYSFFGLVEIPTPFAQGPLTDTLFVVHRASCALLAALVALHVLAVVKHQFIARNGVLRRML
ncbi:cytochrome b [Paraburkholderia acidipaludis]|uniref:cytochrome b n=1 Tax=Paraburkholderia acidipaludis TaxID=660537 RepID=UPI000A04B887|nr:cytochrome b/b6 domain-containing protein [Paraburkholderia acidipaludis]